MERGAFYLIRYEVPPFQLPQYQALALFADDGELLLDPLLFVDDPLFVQIPGARFTHIINKYQVLPQSSLLFG